MASGMIFTGLLIRACMIVLLEAVRSNVHCCLSSLQYLARAAAAIYSMVGQFPFYKYLPFCKGRMGCKHEEGIVYMRPGGGPSHDRGQVEIPDPVATRRR